MTALAALPDSTDSPGPPTRRPAVAPATATRLTGLAAAAVLLVLASAVSIGLGARPLSPADVWRGLTDPSSPAYIVVHSMRLPRTVLGLLAGTGIGLAGAVLQTVTRNPLADPGLLGVNAGAAAAVATATWVFGVTDFGGYIWPALAGAGVVTAAGYVVGGGRSATPARLALAGAALNAALFSYVSAVMLLDAKSLEAMRFWTTGSLASAAPATVTSVLPFIGGGVVLALLLARPLNTLALGDDAARALGSRPALVRGASIGVVTLLCGSATAACGPIVFVGLTVPHIVRSLTGPDLRWVLPYCAVLSPVLLLAADVLGRIVARPGEVQVGVVTSVLGGPVFLYFLLRRRGKAVQL